MSRSVSSQKPGDCDRDLDADLDLDKPRLRHLAHATGTLAETMLAAPDSDRDPQCATNVTVVVSSGVRAGHPEA